MLKKIIIGIITIIIILVIVVMLTLDQIAKAGIEKYAPKVLGVGVQLESVHISPWSGNGSIKGLKIDNPAGFKAEYIFQVKRINVSIDIGSLFSNTIIIRKIHIQDPQIVYETGFHGSNIQALQNNIQGSTAKQKTAVEKQPVSDAKPGKNVVIESLVINGTKVTGSVGFVGTTASIPKIEMKNIGRGGGMSYAQATNLVFSALVRSLATINLNSLGKPLNTAGQTVKTVGTGVEDVGKGIGGVVKGVGGIFSGSNHNKTSSGGQ